MAARAAVRLMRRIRLTLTGVSDNSFPVLSRLYVTIGNVRCTNLNPISNGNTTVLVCNSINEYTALVTGAWLPVVIYDLISLQQSEPAYLVSFTSPSLLAIASVTGCAGDSTTPSLRTGGCDIAGTITLNGSNFVAADGSSPWRLSVGIANSFAPNLPINTYIVDANTVQLPLSLVWTLISSYVTTPSTDVTLYVLHGTQVAGPVVVTIPTPPITVRALTGCGTTGAGLNLTLSGCSPGVSQITIRGTSFSSAILVTVGGQPCTLTSSTATSVVCVVPVPLAAVKDAVYDLFIRNFAGNVTLPAAISYTTNPTIVSVTSPFCPPDFAYPYTNAPIPLYCSAYAQLTLVGVYFQDLSTLTVNITAGYSDQALTCGNLTYESSTDLTCTLPAPPSRSFAQSIHGITAWENATFASNTFRAYLYTVPEVQPNIVAIQGCSSVDSRTRVVSGCRVGDVISVVGSGFVSIGSNTQVQLWADGEVFLCAAPRLLNSSLITCMLPYMPAMAVDTVIPVRIANMNGQQSNWLVAVNYNAATADSTSAANDSRFIITLAVLLPVVTVLIVLLIISLITRKSSFGGKWQQHEQQGSHSGGWRRQSDEKEDSRLEMSGVSVDSSAGRL